MGSPLLRDLPVKIFADGADRDGIAWLYAKDYIKGRTTHPTLMRKVGIADHEKFARAFLEVMKENPISFEVFPDEFPEMRRQALKIGKRQENGLRQDVSPRRRERRLQALAARSNMTGSPGSNLR